MRELKPHVFKHGGKWMLAKWYWTHQVTGARLFVPIQEADTVRGLVPPKSTASRVAGWFQEVLR